MSDKLGGGGGGPQLSLAGVSDYPGGSDPYHPSGAGPGVMVNVGGNFQRSPLQGGSSTQPLSVQSRGYGGSQLSPGGQPNIMDLIRQVGPINMQGNQALGGMPNQGVAQQQTSLGTLSPLQQQALAMILRSY